MSTAPSFGSAVFSVTKRLVWGFPGGHEGVINKPWIVRPFSVEDGAISDTDVAANVEFYRIREDAQLTSDFMEQELATFWLKVKDCPIHSKRALTLLDGPVPLNLSLWGWILSHGNSENEGTQ